jgi:hypothetical protein
MYIPHVLSWPVGTFRRASTTGMLVLAAVLALFDVKPATAVEIVPWGADWDYFDELRRDQSYPNAGSLGWNSTAYNIASPGFGQWRRGVSPFAQGAVDGFAGQLTTPLGGLPNEQTTYLFRKTFNLQPSQAAIASGNISTICDDGCVGYLNGTELFRLNMPIGAVIPGTFATGAGIEHLRTNIAVSLPPGLLRAGANLLAVEVHNASLSSPDVGFGLRFSIGSDLTDEVSAARRLRAIAATDDPAPGFGSNARFGDLYGFESGFYSHTINASGDGAFFGTAVGPGVDDLNMAGIWVGRRSDLRLLARGGDAAPGLPAGSKFLQFGAPWLNDSGTVAFHAPTVNELLGQTTEGIWSSDGTTLRLVAATGLHAPGTPVGVSFKTSDEFRLSNFRLNQGGHLGFTAALAGTGVSSGNDHGAWVERNGVIESVAREGSAVPPGMAASAIWSRIDVPVVNDLGEFVVSGDVADSPFAGTPRGAGWLQSASGAQLIAKHGDRAPGLAEGWTLADISFPFLDNHARVFMRGRAVSDEGSSIEAVWFGTPGAMSLVAFDGMTAEGLPAGARIAHISSDSSPHYNDNGATVFTARLAHDSALGIDETNDQAIVVHREGRLSVVAREGDTAPELPDGSRFDLLPFVQPLINNHGQVAFLASLRSATYPNARTAAFAEDRQGNLQLLAVSGDELNLGPGRLAETALIYPLPGYGQFDGDSYRPAWTDNGQFSMRVVFNQQSGAILVSDRLLVPEPSASLLALLAGCLIVARRGHAAVCVRREKAGEASGSSTHTRIRVVVSIL